MKAFIVLGFESSCDDTGAAVLLSDGTILGESLASQQSINEMWVRIVPSFARDRHVAEIDNVIANAIKNSGLDSINDV